jgi:hypothetical protein
MTEHSIASWQVAAWAPVYCTMSEFDAMVAAMRRLGGSVETVAEHGGRRGSALWGVCKGEVRAGIAWDWAEMRKGVLVIDDPMSVLSNIRVMEDGDDGCELPGRVLTLNRAIHSFSWQSTVRLALPAPFRERERLAA